MIDQRLVARVEQGACRAIGHREGAVVRVERRLNEVVQGVLVNAGVRTERRVVACGYQAVLGADDLGSLPHLGDLDLVHPVPPRVPNPMCRLVVEIGK